MSTLMVWSYEVDLEDGYAWKKVPTEHKVGSRAELLFWRVKDAASGETSKDYFYSHHEYEAFSGNSIDQYEEQVDAWTEQHKAAEFDITQTKINATIVSNGRSYASCFPTEEHQQT